jgi:glucose/arabinose dehydrogenase
VGTGAQSSPPAGFTDSLVTGAVDSPTALAFFANGDGLITAKNGVLWHLPAGSNTPTEALDLSASVCSNSERGLLGVAIHPAFSAANNWVYLYYTARRPDSSCVNRVSRFRFTAGVADPASEQILLNNMRSTAGNHNGGDVQFGKDRLLYVSIGDSGVSGTAQRKNVLAGKILRITADGGIPRGNPFKGKRTSRCHVSGQTLAKRACREIFAFGLRNPYRIAHDPNVAGVRLFINDVGQSTWEEIDRGVAGANYGWPRREGPCNQGTTARKQCGKPPRAFTNPIHAYRHTTGCRSITGGAFVPHGAGWPAHYRGDYLFADFVCGTIFRLEKKGKRFTRHIFATNAGGVTHMTFGPGGDLYYTTFEGGGEVRRVSVAP